MSLTWKLGEKAHTRVQLKRKTFGSSHKT